MFLRAIPRKMKLEVDSQISNHELKLVVFIGSYTLKVSLENSRYCASALDFHLFLRYRMRGFVLEKHIGTHIMLPFWNHFL